jgi:hypothetical protein
VAFSFADKPSVATTNRWKIGDRIADARGFGMLTGIAMGIGQDFRLAPADAPHINAGSIS